MKSTLLPAISAAVVAGFFLFASLWVNGGFPVPIAVGIAFALGAATYLAASQRSRRTGEPSDLTEDPA